MRSARTTSRADLDLLQIWTYIAPDNIAKADEVIDCLYVRFEQLARQPEPGQACDELASGVRQLTILGYVIYYRVTDVDIVILRVVHGAREQRQLFE
jgi:toxin ParE1/3/4